jgi:ACS family hexuronate transporter-like MFS transporter
MSAVPPTLMPARPPQESPADRLREFVASHQRWLIVLLLFFVAAVNNLDRQTLSVLAPTLRENLGFGAVEYSYIVSGFLVAYTLGYTFCGTVLDRVGIKVGLAIALGFWSLAGMFHAAAAGWIGLLICRFLLGLGESFNSPAGVKALAEWIPSRERGLSMAVFSNGNVMGAIIAPPLVSLLTVTLGWRWAFIITGATGLVLLVIWWRSYDSPETHPGLRPEERTYILENRAKGTAATASDSFLTLLRQPICVGFFLARLLTDPITYFYAFWLPDYLTHSRGFSLVMIGLVGWIPFLASDIGGPGGGFLSDRLVRRGMAPARARLLLMFVAAILMPLACLAVRTPTAWVSVALIAVLLGAQSCWMANQLTLISESVSRSSVATLLSLSALGGSLGGIVCTLLTGQVLKQYGYVPIFTILGFMHLLAFGILVLSRRLQDARTRSTHT